MFFIYSVTMHAFMLIWLERPILNKLVAKSYLITIGMMQLIILQAYVHITGQICAEENLIVNVHFILRRILWTKINIGI
jgi:hypothetical protein